MNWEDYGRRESCKAARSKAAADQEVKRKREQHLKKLLDGTSLEMSDELAEELES